MTQVKLPKSISQYTNRQTIIDIESETLFDALSSITRTYNLGSALLKEDGSIQPYISVVMGNRFLDKALLANPLSVNVANMQIQIKTAFAGG